MKPAIANRDPRTPSGSKRVLAIEPSSVGGIFANWVAGFSRNWTTLGPLISPLIFSLRARGLAPEVLEPVRCQLGVPDRVLDVAMAKPGLQRSGVVTGVGQCKAAGVAQHVREDLEGHSSTLA
jgi:hypothetical protein